MTPSYDAQHNEFCAYVLSESETPFGMTLGNFKTYVSCTPKGGVRGLWDADSDRIIFGTHQIAYRLRDRARSILPHQIEREFTFLPYAQISEFALDERLLVTECFYVPHGPAHDRSVAFVIDVTLHNSSAEPVGTRRSSLGVDGGSAVLRRTGKGSPRGSRWPVPAFVERRERRRALLGRFARAARGDRRRARASAATSNAAWELARRRGTSTK